MGLTSHRLIDLVDVFDDRWVPWLEKDEDESLIEPTLAQRLDIQALWEIQDESGGRYLTDRYVLVDLNELPDPRDLAPVMHAHMSAPSALDAALAAPDQLKPLTCQTFEPWHLLVLEAWGVEIKAIDVPPLSATHLVPCALLRDGRVIGLVQPRRNGVASPLPRRLLELADEIYDSGVEVTRRVAVRAAWAVYRHLQAALAADEGSTTS